MCGIFGLIEINNNNNQKDDKSHASDIFENYKSVITNAHNNLSHRGPDTYGNNLIVDPEFNKHILMLHTRLRINGDDSSQPMTNHDNTIYLVINGEIFNWKQLEKELDYKCTKSDCEIIFPLYEKYKDNIPMFFNKLQGQFSLFLYDLTTRHILIGRDPIGVTPLYIGYKKVKKTKSGLSKQIDRFVISSELKCLTMPDDSGCGPYKGDETESLVDNIKVFNPRKYIYECIDENLNQNRNSNYLDCMMDYTNFYEDFGMIETESNFTERERRLVMERIREKLIDSVKSQIEDLIVGDSNLRTPEFGVLLSGGLDSSLIASIVVSLAKDLGYTKKIKTFSVGVDSTVPDLVAARTVAEFLDTDHQEFYFTIKQGLDSIEKVIWHTETYDCTSIRASTPMYLLTKSIKEKYPNMKVLFSGELSDELLCYLYGANAPSEGHFQTETLNLVSNVHLFDCLRANKTCMANSMEVRVPFTDINFVRYILSLHPRWKTFGTVPNVTNKMEKQILRDSFYGYLPNSILYRKKEQFSDGVSGFKGKENNWIDGIKDYCEKKYSDDEFDKLRSMFTYNVPNTKEKLFYRLMFCNLFNNTVYKNSSESIIKTWEPKWSNSSDPSGRVQNFWIKN